MPGSSTGRKRTAGKVGRKKKADISCIQNATTQKIASKVVTRSVAAASTAKSAITQLNSPSSKQKPAPSMTRVEEKTSTAPSDSEAPASSTRAEQKQNSAPSMKNVEEAMVSGPSHSEAPLASEDHVHDEQKVIASLPTEKSIPPPLKDNDQVVPQQEDNGDDGEDIRQSSPEDNGPPAPQLEHYEKEEKVTTPPEATPSQPSENWSLSLSDDSLEEFSDEISEWSFASSHRTAIPGDEDYESNNEEAALSPVTEARDCHTTFKHGPNISFTILDLPFEMAQGDEIYTKRNWSVGRLHARVQGSNTLKNVDFDEGISSDEVNHLVWNSQSEIRHVLGKGEKSGCRDKYLEILGAQIGFLKRQGIGARIDAMEKKREGKAKKKVGPGDEGVGALETEMATKRARRKAGLGDEDLNDYWDPSGVTRNRKPNIGLSAEQVQLREQRMKRTDLKAVFANDKPTHHTEVFSNLLLQSENLLQAARQDENERRVASRMKKATAQYQKELNRCYRNDIEANRFIKKYKISPPVLNKFQDHDEISMIRYEPPTAEKGNKATFTITCGPKKGIRIPNVRVEYLEYYLGRGFVDNCISFGEKCATNGLNQPSFHVPLGDSNSDIASDICLFKIDKNGNGVKALPFVQGASDCCLGFSLANALHHLKYHAKAHALYAFSHNLTDYDATSQFKMLSHWVHCSVGAVECLSVKASRKFDGLNGFAQCITLLEEQELVIFVPQARDGTKTHAVTFCHGLIFDATQQYPPEAIGRVP